LATLGALEVWVSDWCLSHSLNLLDAKCVKAMATLEEYWLVIPFRAVHKIIPANLADSFTRSSRRHCAKKKNTRNAQKLDRLGPQMISETQVGAYGAQRGPLLKRHIQAGGDRWGGTLADTAWND